MCVFDTPIPRHSLAPFVRSFLVKLTQVPVKNSLPLSSIVAIFNFADNQNISVLMSHKAASDILSALTLLLGSAHYTDHHRPLMDGPTPVGHPLGDIEQYRPVAPRSIKADEVFPLAACHVHGWEEFLTFEMSNKRNDVEYMNMTPTVGLIFSQELSTINHGWTAHRQ